jgi:hypothetical protein
VKPLIKLNLAKKTATYKQKNTNDKMATHVFLAEKIAINVGIWQLVFEKIDNIGFEASIFYIYKNV